MDGVETLVLAMVFGELIQVELLHLVLGLLLLIVVLIIFILKQVREV
jgi:hypothetical protein